MGLIVVEGKGKSEALYWECRWQPGPKQKDKHRRLGRA